MTIKDVLKEKIVEVNEAYPSIYTKEDVVKLLVNIQNTLDDVDEDEDKSRMPSLITAFEDDFTTIIRDKITSYDIVDNVRLSLSYNEILVEADLDELADDIDSKIEELFSEFRQHAKKEMA
jgi:hypothetical protein